MKRIKKFRHEARKKTDTPTKNIIDEMVGQYLSTLYKFKFLR